MDDLFKLILKFRKTGDATAAVKRTGASSAEAEIQKLAPRHWFGGIHGSSFGVSYACAYTTTDSRIAEVSYIKDQ